MRTIFCILLFVMTISLPKQLFAQTSQYDTVRVEAYITPEGDTIPQSWLPTVMVSAVQTNALKNYWLANVQDEKIRKQIIKYREKELKREFADKVTSLSVYQGKVLMKLINRETGNNCYQLIKEYKGGLNAGLWQTVAFVFGSSLKQPYSPNGDDQEIEKLVLEVQKVYGTKG